MKRIHFIILIFFILLNSFYAQSTLSAGDIAIIEYNSDGTSEDIKFLALRSMEIGTTINFTDNGWITTGVAQFRTGEANTPRTWTATSTVSCGDIINFPVTPGGGADFNLGGSGDQILAYQGTSASPTFIFAINNEGSGVWQASATSARTSGLPSGLTDGVNAVAIQEVDNVIYSGPLSGSRETILSNICDKSNWNSGSTSTSSNTVNQIFTDTFNSSATWDGSSWDISGSNFFTGTIDGSYSTASNGDFRVCNCTVNASETLTINSGGTVTVEDNITNNGNITVNSGGSVVQIRPNGSNSGSNYTVERTTPSQSSFNVFTYWSSPISTATFAAVAPTTHEYFSFDATTQSWVLGTAATPMIPGIGYALEGPDTGSYPGPQTATFTGAAFNNGNVSVNLSFSSDGDTDNDWNLIGNPYPSAIDGNTFLTANSASIGGTIYFWTHNTAEDGTVDNTQDDYAMYNASGGTAAVTGGTVPDGNIASGQGFFAQALVSGSVNLFTNDMRISGNNSLFFKSNRKHIEKDRVWLDLEGNNASSQILIGFFEDATDEVDTKYDGVRFVAQTNLNFYSILNDKYFGIQGKSTLKNKEIIDIGFTSSKEGDFTISISNLEGKLKDAEVHIKDNLIETTHNLKKSNFNFSTDKAGVFNDRFQLLINKKEEKTLSLDENSISNKLLLAKDKKNLIIESLENNLIKEVYFYNILGKEILTVKKASSSSIEVPLSKFDENFITIVKVMLENGNILRQKILL
jgi:hypothetical protein